MNLVFPSESLWILLGPGGPGEPCESLWFHYCCVVIAFLCCASVISMMPVPSFSIVWPITTTLYRNCMRAIMPSGTCLSPITSNARCCSRCCFFHSIVFVYVRAFLPGLKKLYFSEKCKNEVCSIFFVFFVILFILQNPPTVIVADSNVGVGISSVSQHLAISGISW